MKKLLYFFPFILMSILALSQCGKKTEVQEIERKITIDSDKVYCDDSRPGDFRDIECSEGFEGVKLEVCSDRGKWVVANDSCVQSSCFDDGRDIVSFSDVKPMLDKHCVSCHYTPENITNYAVASAWADEIYRRLRLPQDNVQFMPFKKPPLSVDEIDLFRKWIDDGKSNGKACPVEAKRVDLNYIESQMLSYLNEIDSQDRTFVRFLVSAHDFNLGIDHEKSLIAMNKTLNSLSFDDQINNCTFIDQKKTVCAFDFRTFKQTSSNWDLIEKADKIKFKSNTNKGLLIKQLTGTDSPWFHYDNYIDIALGNPDVYYEIMNVPNYYGDFLEQFGIVRRLKLLNNDAVFLGFNGSPISILKNRLLVRYDAIVQGVDRVCWTTYDPIELDGVKERNIFQFPFVDVVQSNKIFDYAAGETICQLPNKMLIFTLYNSAGVRQDAAPTNIVTDIRGLDPEIQNPIDCLRCHNAGFIPARDQVRNLALKNDIFDQKEKDIIRLIYKKNSEVSAYFNKDNLEYADGLKAIGANVIDADPINKSYDRFRNDQSIEKIAAFLLVTVDEMISCISESGQIKNQIGQLLNGDNVTHDQLILALPIIFKDCNDILNDKLGS